MLYAGVRCDVDLHHYMSHLQEPTSDGISTDYIGQQMVIWGTDVIVEHCKRKFTKFLQKFVNEEVEEDETLMDMGTQLPFYMARIEEVTSYSHQLC